MNTKKTFAAISVTALLFAFAGCQAPEQKKQTQDEVETATQPDQEVSLRINEPAAAGADGVVSTQAGTTEQVDQSAKPFPPSLQFPDMSTQEGIKVTDVKIPEIPNNGGTTTSSLEQNSKIVESAIAAQDGTKCKELKESNLIASCEFNVYTNLAAQKKDPTLCKKITSTDAQKICEQSMQ